MLKDLWSDSSISLFSFVIELFDKNKIISRTPNF
jgi:hypothetical protein